MTVSESHSAFLFHSVDAARFLANHWQRGHFLDRSGDRHRFAGVMSLDDIDAIVARAASSDTARLHIVEDGRAVPVPLRTGDARSTGLSDAYRAYERKRALLITQVQQVSEPARRLCRAMEAMLVAHGVLLARTVSANVYVSPPDSRGFPPHYDDHDAFVLQTDGEKHWRVYDPRDPFPVDRDASSVGPDDLPPLRERLNLGLGDLLYIPRGYYHDAVTSTSHSVHVTLSVFACTWIDLIAAASRRCPGLREALPAGAASEPERTLADLRVRLDALVDGPAVGTTARRMRNQFVDRLEVLPDNGFRQLQRVDAIDLDTRVCRRPGSFVRVVPDGADVQLAFTGSSVMSSREMEPVFAFVAATDTFAPRDLPDILADAGKVEIVRELVAAGLLKLVD